MALGTNLWFDDQPNVGAAVRPELQMPAARFVEDVADTPFVAGPIEIAATVRFGTEGDLGWRTAWRYGGDYWTPGGDPPDDLYFLARSDR